MGDLNVPVFNEYITNQTLMKNINPIKLGKWKVIDKNTRIEEFFDPFVREDGSWDFDALSSHRAVADNIDQIVSAAYRQGVGDGQKGLVNKAANVSTASPQQGTNTSQTESPLAEQVKSIMNQNSSKMTFKI